MAQASELRIEKRLLRSADMIVTVSSKKRPYAKTASWPACALGNADQWLRCGPYDTRARTARWLKTGIEFVYTGRLFKNRRVMPLPKPWDACIKVIPAWRARWVRLFGGVEDTICARYDEILALRDCPSL